MPNDIDPQAGDGYSDDSQARNSSAGSRQQAQSTHSPGRGPSGQPGESGPAGPAGSSSSHAGQQLQGDTSQRTSQDQR